MGLNESRGNMYDWVTHTWNAIKGECPHGCTYCYMKRWGEQKPVRLHRREFRTDLGHGNFIFVGSSCDMFAEDIPLEWIVETLSHCAKFRNQYLFQSKNPRRMLEILTPPTLRGYLNGTVICTTIETNRLYPEIMQASPPPMERARWMSRAHYILPRYVTIEPIMDFDLGELVEMIKLCEPKQVNIGADSGKHDLPEPDYAKVIDLIEALSEFTTISRKKNLDRLSKTEV